MNLFPATHIAHTVTELFEPATLDLPNPLVYANFSAQCDAPARRSLLSRNLPRRACMPAVVLLRYPPGTLVYGDRSYLTVAGDAIVREQVAPWCADPVAEAMAMRADSARAIDVGQACLLLARFGESTWGHWVAEMLAKAAIAERFFPGRFCYAVPWWTTERTETRGYADSVLESLAAFGILPDRLVRMGGFQIYRFAALHDISGFWQDGPHPGSLESLQALTLPKSRARRPSKIALLRRPPFARAVFDADAVEGVLRSLGFSVVDFSAQSFAAQIRLFRGADLVLGSLGSHFVGALFAGPAKKLISVAPADWADGYFINLFQHVGAHHADVRGAPVRQAGVPPERAPHRVGREDIVAAMDAVLQPAGDDARLVDGEAVPHRLGACVLNLSFAAGAAEDVDFMGGWSDPEPTHRWSLGPSSGLRFARARLPADAPLWLEIEGQGHVYPPGLPTRPLSILVNDIEAGAFDVIGHARYFCRLSPDMFSGEGRVVLTFVHPVCPSPRMMVGGADDRRLGFGFERLVFYGVP